MTSKSSRMPDEAKHGTLKSKTKKTMGPLFQKRINEATCKKYFSGSLFCAKDCRTNKWYQMIMSTRPSKPKHFGFDAAGFCSGATGAAVVSGVAASFSSP